MAEDFYNPNLPLAETCVLIPVAAHQESSRIYNSLEQYAGQQDADRFSVCMYFNFPDSFLLETIKPAILELNRAKQAFPQLDIRLSFSSHDAVPIGQVRKDLWDAATRLAVAEGIYDQPGREVLGINHDIDTERISPHYIRNIQRHYEKIQTNLNRDDLAEETLPSRYTQVKHAYPFATHPNIAKAILWSDLTYRQTMRQGVFEEGLVIPLSYYVKKGGFKPSSITHETQVFAPSGSKGIPGTPMDTSPRRYIARIAENELATIWTKDSFTVTDECRNPDIVRNDITHSELEDRIFNTLDNDLQNFSKGVNKQVWQDIIMAALFDEAGGMSRQEATAGIAAKVETALEPRLNLARTVLVRIIGSPTLASMVDATYMKREVNDFVKAIHCEITAEAVYMLRTRIVK